jgi:hypothetical protein
MTCSYDRRGTLARFINSSCAPNCEAQKWHDAATGEIRVGIFAAQDIDPGVELTYDYMFQHAGTAVHAGAYRCVHITLRYLYVPFTLTADCLFCLSCLHTCAYRGFRLGGRCILDTCLAEAMASMWHVCA